MVEMKVLHVLNKMYSSSFSTFQRTTPLLPPSLLPSWLRWVLTLRPSRCPLGPLRPWSRDHMVPRSPTQACSSSSSSSSPLHPWTLQCPRPVWRVHLERPLEMLYRYTTYIKTTYWVLHWKHYDFSFFLCF